MTVPIVGRGPCASPNTIHVFGVDLDKSGLQGLPPPRKMTWLITKYLHTQTVLWVTLKVHPLLCI